MTDLIKRGDCTRAKAAPLQVPAATAYALYAPSFRPTTFASALASWASARELDLGFLQSPNLGNHTLEKGLCAR